MKILVTGSNGFIGKNLVLNLKNRGYTDIFCFDINDKEEILDKYCEECNFVFNLAGINRPKDASEFMQGNCAFADNLLYHLKKHKNYCPIMLSSSIQAVFDNEYGKSKKAGENLLFEYSKSTGADVFIYRFPNVFGKWCRPNYNSAVATFCNNIANGLPITVNDRSTLLTLVYIDDLIDEMIRCLQGKANKAKDGFCYVDTIHQVTLGQIIDLLYSFNSSRENKYIPDMSDPFTKKLYSTYLSYLPESGFSYPLVTHSDARGSFTEILKSFVGGQVSVNISKPHITKGNHWHNTKIEKFIVVSGNGVIRFRNPLDGKIIEYFVSGEKLEVIDIPVGYTHNIENTGDTDMVTIMWCNECFNPDKPDTYFLEV